MSYVPNHSSHTYSCHVAQEKLKDSRPALVSANIQFLRTELAKVQEPSFVLFCSKFNEHFIIEKKTKGQIKLKESLL